MTYAEQLKHPEWQKKRLEVLQASNFECEICTEKEKTLNVHHKIYRKGKKAWEYSLSEYACLCEDCHKLVHDTQDELKECLALIPHHANVLQVLGYIKALLSAYDEPVKKIANYPEACGASDFYRINVNLCLEEDHWHGEPNALYKLAQMIHAQKFGQRRG